MAELSQGEHAVSSVFDRLHAQMLPSPAWFHWERNAIAFPDRTEDM